MSEASRIRVFSVDDHALLREGIAAIITNEPDMVLVAQASTGREAMRQFRTHQPDVTLMDLRLPDMSGIDALIAIRTEVARRAHHHADDVRGRCGDAARARRRGARLSPQEHAAEGSRRRHSPGARGPEEHPGEGGDRSSPST